MCVSELTFIFNILIPVILSRTSSTARFFILNSVMHPRSDTGAVHISTLELELDFPCRSRHL